MNWFIKFIGGLFDVVGKVFNYMETKNNDNKISNYYESEKRADVLEEDKISSEQLSKSSKKIDEAKQKLNILKNTSVDDAEKSDSEISTILNNIEDEEEKKEKEAQINAAKELKKRKSILKEKKSNDTSFNNGENTIFVG